MFTRKEHYKNIETQLIDITHLFYDHTPGEPLSLTWNQICHFCNVNIKTIQNELEELMLLEEKL